MSDLQSDCQTWDRQPGEPARWYGIFVQYFLGAGHARTLRKAYLAFLRGNKQEKLAEEREHLETAPRWRRMAAEWKWYERAKDYEEYQTELTMATVEEASKMLRMASIDAVTALILSLTSERFRVSAAKEILDRAGLPGTVVTEHRTKLTADDLAKAKQEVEEWLRQKTPQPTSG